MDVLAVIAEVVKKFSVSKTFVEAFLICIRVVDDPALPLPRFRTV
jgi:hypothetical protein